VGKVPKKKVKAKTRKPGGKLTETQQINLVGGRGIKALMAGAGMSSGKPAHCFNREEERRKAWEQNRDSLFYLEHISGKGFVERAPFTRGPGWWDYEAPEPKRIIKNGEYYGLAEEVEGKGWCFFSNKVLYKLKPEYVDKYRHYTDAPEMEYETTKDYLIRLDLVTSWDIEREQAICCDCKKERSEHNA